MFFRKASYFSDHLLSHPRRILIVRFSAVGDVIHTLPLLAALRTRFPHAEIAWLIEEKTSKLLLGHWALDRLIIVRKNWTKSWSEIAFLRKRLQMFAPDITIDVQGLFKSSFAAWLSGAKCRIGFGGIDGREGSQWFNNYRIIPNAEHIIDRNLCLLEPFGVYGSSIDFDLPECEMDRRSAFHLLNREGLHGHFAILNVGAGWESKRWRENRYAEVAQYLLTQWNLPSLIVWAGDEEQKMAETVVQSANGAAFIAPPTTLGELAALARMATIFIGSDTGPLHIAAAVGTSCLGLYGPMPAKRNSPYGIQCRFIQKQTLENNRRIRPHRAPRTLMDAIDTETVCNMCDEMLAQILSNDTSLPIQEIKENNPLKKRKAA
ncbi:MAG: glycosyltransferase family 9 protein [Planctomycetaceae bacterium]|jgi:lipopolysaccharide heptosyltransferase I|nr:glycosyltransferase family 9 protein [Planctomycetaceae bacterium]